MPKKPVMSVPVNGSRVVRDSSRVDATAWWKRIAAGAALLPVLALPGAARAVPGKVIWREKVKMQSTFEGQPALTLGGTAVLLATAVEDPEDGDPDLVVRSYSAENGRLRWEDRHDVDGLYEYARDVDVEAGRAFVVGLRTDQDDEDYAWIVRAYRASDGDLLWSDEPELPAVEMLAGAVAAQSQLAFVGGRAQQSPLSTDWLVRAYDAPMGEIAWEDSVDFGDADFVRDIVARGPFVVASGVGGGDWVVRAHDAETGAFLWQDRFDNGLADDAAALAVRGNRVFVAGLSQSEPGMRLDWLVRAYDVRAGTLLWQDRLGPGSWASSIAVSGDGVFVTGSDSTSDGSRRSFLLRAYRPKNGQLLWEDRFDLPGRLDEGCAVVTVGSNLFVTAGTTTEGSPEADSIIRMYDARTGDLAWTRRLGKVETNELPVTGALAGAANRIFMLANKYPHVAESLRDAGAVLLRSLDTR